jgi:type IV pilus assembly protein PilV
MKRAIHRKRQSGVSLLEAMLAILIFSVGILALVALQSVSVKATTESKFRADAGFLASQMIGRMWSDYQGFDLGEYVYNAGGADCGAYAGGGGNAAVAAWVAAVRDTLPGATDTSIQIRVTSNPGQPDHNRVAINICWQPPGADDWRRFATVTQINM